MTKKFTMTFWSHYHIWKQLKGKYQDEYKFISFYNSHNVDVLVRLLLNVFFDICYCYIYMAQNVLKFIFCCTFWLYIIRLNFPEFLHELISTDFLDFWIICQSLSLQNFDTLIPVKISQHKKVLFPRVSQIRHKI